MVVVVQFGVNGAVSLGYEGYETMDLVGGGGNGRKCRPTADMVTGQPDTATHRNALHISLIGYVH